MIVAANVWVYLWAISKWYIFPAISCLCTNKRRMLVKLNPCWPCCNQLCGRMMGPPSALDYLRGRYQRIGCCIRPNKVAWLKKKMKTAVTWAMHTLGGLFIVALSARNLWWLLITLNYRRLQGVNRSCCCLFILYAYFSSVNNTTNDPGKVWSECSRKHSLLCFDTQI